MYYEAIEHELKQVASAEEAAKMIKEGTALSYWALEWTNENGTFLAVSDAHIDDDPFAETAMFQKRDNEYFQIESITAAWCSEKDLKQTFLRTEKDQPINIEKDLIIGKATNQTAYFTCGCCGNCFYDLVSKQIKYDQDAGYGICDQCRNR